MFLYFFRRNWRFEYKQNSRSGRKPSGRCLSETDICLRAFCRSGSSSGLRLPPLRTMPIHKIVSKEHCQSYFIDGCQVRPIRRDARYKNRVNQPRLCASAHRGVPLYFCMARNSQFTHFQSASRWAPRRVLSRSCWSC